MIESLAPPMPVERLDFIRVTRGDDADVSALLAEIDRLQCLCDAAEEAFPYPVPREGALLDYDLALMPPAP